jgi:hypothetical protein
MLYDTATREITYSSVTSAASKTFIIDHPTDADKYLVHGCLEGPEVGVYYRGKAEIVYGASTVKIKLPAYVDSLASEFTVQVTSIFNGLPIKTPYQVSEVKNGEFTIHGEPGKMFWHVYGKRGDITVEPLKDSVSVKGSGPYKWI